MANFMENSMGSGSMIISVKMECGFPGCNIVHNFGHSLIKKAEMSARELGWSCQVRYGWICPRCVDGIKQGKPKGEEK